MPEEFLKCVKNGGKVITKKLSKDTYQHICYLNGKRYVGEIKYKKKSKKK